MVKSLRNMYWESELDQKIESKVKELKLKSKSEYLRLVLRRQFSLCLVDRCFAPALSGDYCQRHQNEK